MNGSKTALDPEIAQAVRLLSYEARHVVEGLWGGTHRSPHRGASIVFLEHREYRPGDDPRLLDWRAYARTDRHSIKRFEQEAHVRTMLVLDQSSSMSYAGSEENGTSKGRYASTLLAALAYLFLGQGDAAGLARVDRAVSSVVPARSHTAHLGRLLETLSAPIERDRTTDLRAALSSIADRFTRRGVVIVASDLLDFKDGALAPIGTLVARGHDVMILHVLHRDELEFPFHGPAKFEGLEGEAHVEADPDAIRTAYLEELHEFLRDRQDRCTSVGARYALARTDGRPEEVLANLLVGRGRRGYR